MPPEFSFKLTSETLEHKFCDDPPILPFDWPNNLINRICEVMQTPWATPMPTEFSFEFTSEAAEHNLAIMRKYDFELGRALEANKYSPLGPGKEFKPSNVLRKIFSLHPLWQQTKSILELGSNWPLEEISKKARKNNVLHALTFGNHKVASPNLLQKLISKDAKFGYSFALPLSSLTSIPGICMAPMNIMAQNTINECSCIVPKDRFMHNQSWKWLLGTSVNSRVIKELLKECKFGYCICRLVNWAVAARRKYPGQRILATKIDYKSAYR
jgi:hypothetical protein